MTKTYRPRLTGPQVRQIRRLHAEGLTFRAIADFLQIGINTARSVALRLSYTEIRDGDDAEFRVVETVFDQLIMLMREHPAEAMKAVRRVQIAGRRGRRGSRKSPSGRSVAAIHDRGPRAFGSTPSKKPEYKAGTESLSDFTARIDRLWVEAGWVLVDADGTVHRRVAS